MPQTYTKKEVLDYVLSQLDERPVGMGSCSTCVLADFAAEILKAPNAIVSPMGTCIKLTPFETIPCALGEDEAFIRFIGNSIPYDSYKDIKLVAQRYLS